MHWPLPPTTFTNLPLSMLREHSTTSPTPGATVFVQDDCSVVPAIVVETWQFTEQLVSVLYGLAIMATNERPSAAMRQVNVPGFTIGGAR